MADLIYFISADTLKGQTVINGNVDNKLLNPTILEVQDLEIQRLLGTDLYNELRAEIKNNSVSSDNAVLLQDYIMPALKYYALANFSLPSVYKIMNKSSMTKDSDYGTALTDDQLKTMRDYYNSRAESYGDKLVKFLIQNSSTYTSYLNGNNGIDKEKPKRNAYFPGVVLTRTTIRGSRYGVYPSSLSALDNGGCCDEYIYEV